jgi:DNA-binding transcriptional ArsR family regulator
LKDTTSLKNLPENQTESTPENRHDALQAIDIDAIHKALANPVRRDILTWLKTPEAFFSMQEYPIDIGVCAGLIDQRAGLSQSTVSAHLAALQKAGLITSKRVGQWIFFRRDDAVIAAFLDQIKNDL